MSYLMEQRRKAMKIRKQLLAGSSRQAAIIPMELYKKPTKSVNVKKTSVQTSEATRQENRVASYHADRSILTPAQSRRVEKRARRLKNAISDGS